MTAMPGASGSNGAFSDLFGTEVEALWVATGTAANSLALAALCPPHGSIVCHRDAHIQTDECGAPEFYTARRQIAARRGRRRQADAGEVDGLLATVRDDVHQVQPARALDHQRDRIWPASTRPTRRRRSASSPGARARLPCRRRALRQCGGEPRLRAGRPELAGRRRRALASASSRMAGFRPSA